MFQSLSHWVRPYGLLILILPSVCFRLFFLQTSLLCFSIYILEHDLLTTHQRLINVLVPNFWETVCLAYLGFGAN